MFVIKRKGEYLCYFTFRQGFDYRPKSALTAFSHIYGEQTITPEMQELEKTWDGKIVQI